MEARMLRLMLLIAVALFVGCCGYSAYCFHEEDSLDGYVQSEYREVQKWNTICHDDTEPAFQKPLACGSYKASQARFTHLSELRFEYRYKSQDFLKAGLTLPFLPVLLFYAGKWVLTGRLRNLRTPQL